MFKGGLDRLTGENEEGRGNERQDVPEDPEVLAARIEQEERRKERHRRMEADREKMRRNIREKYNIKKKDDANEPVEGRIMGNRKTPEQVAVEHQQEDDTLDIPGIIGQLGLTETLEKAKTTVNGAIDTLKGILNIGPFSKKLEEHLQSHGHRLLHCLVVIQEISSAVPQLKKRNIQFVQSISEAKLTLAIQNKIILSG
ncbi:hypothetical protein Y032_0185g1048 [Ancylostoma ceylanicum]|uniref:Synaphin protein n=1 Tax=Ancylostoma ceylanicum TaxID=53326 RepID=A0A016SR82_9BILA|nr:hypothetical protein Y032_0185g1048 [Ancylostoma ceylanicum]